MKKIFSIIAILLLLASIIPLVSATDTTAPLVNMYLGQDENLLSHTTVSYTFTVWAKFWNRDDESNVDYCEVDWGEGSGWGSVSKGTEDVRYMVSHTYSTPGEKIVKYKCTSAGGTNAGNVQHVDWDSINIISTDTTPPFINMYLGQDQDLLSHNLYSYSLTVWAKFWNRDDETNVNYCEVDWGEGSGWGSVSKGTEDNRYMVSHTYSSLGEKIVKYRCTSIGGTNTGNVQHVDWDSINIIQWQPGQPPIEEEEGVVYPQRMVRISKFDVINELGDFSVIVSIDNLAGRNLEEVHVVAIIPELGVRTAARTFDLASKKTVTKRLVLDLPENSEGDYTVMLVVSNDEFRRVVFREFSVNN